MEMVGAKRAAATAGRPSAGAVATKAVMRAARRLELSNRSVAAILGLSEATVSRMGSGSYTLQQGEKPFELAVLFLRLFRSLDAIVDGDDGVAASWLRADNRALRQPPLSLIQTVAGLVHVLGYLDSRRALA